MLLDNKKITLVKYQGTRKFIAGLFYSKEEKEPLKKYYFGFARTTEPIISIADETECFSTLSGPITRLGERKMTFSAESVPSGAHDRLFCLISIEPEEFDSMYKLLECIYNE